MIFLRRKIKSQREEAIYRQRQRRRMLLDGVIIILGLFVMGGVIYGASLIIRSGA